FRQGPPALGGGADREDDRPAALAHTLERAHDPLDRRRFEQIGSQLDDVGAVGGRERVDLVLAAGRDDAGSAAERDRADARRPAHAPPDGPWRRARGPTVTVLPTSAPASFVP